MRFEIPLLIAGLAASVSAEWSLTGYPGRDCEEHTSKFAIAGSNDWEGEVDTCIEITSSTDIFSILADSDDGIEEIQVFNKEGCDAQGKMAIRKGECSDAEQGPELKIRPAKSYYVKTK